MTAPATCCPVPAEQLPVNEYKSLKESWFFGWSGAVLSAFLTKLGSLWGISALIVLPIAASSFDPSEAAVQFLLATSGGGFFLMSLVLLRLYLGWSYVHRRLYSETVYYEETGWYDGQSWPKPPQELAQDRLITTYQVLPILRRLKACFGVLGLLSAAGAGLWHFF
jgi:Conserved in the green lineage and diatoms 27